MEPSTPTTVTEITEVTEIAPSPSPERGLDLGALIGVRAPGIEMRRGWQRSLRREVLVQQPVVGAGPEVGESLHNEARILAGLDHPHVLPIHAVSAGPQGVQVVTPLVPGAPWSERLGQPWVIRDRFGSEDVLAWHGRVLLQVCAAVAHAHEQGILHLDLRPESVWIGDLGEVYLTTWALGTPAQRTRLYTQEDAERVGSASHFAPEMLMRTAGRPGPRTDVYQLGGILYQILVGEPPHRGVDLDEAIRHVLFSDPEISSDAPPSLSSVCKRAMARNPAARYPDVRAFAAAVREGLAQRSAWVLAAEADHALEDLRRLLRDPDASEGEVFRTFGAVRLGFQRALAEAPTLDAASMRLQTTVAWMVRWSSARGDKEAARSLLSELPLPASYVLEDSEEILPEDAARPPAFGRVPTWMVPVTLLWVPAPLLAYVVDPVEIALLIGSALAALASTLARLPSLRRTQRPPPILTWATVAFVASAAGVALGIGLHLPSAAIGALVAIIGLVTTGAAAFVLHPRLLPPAVAYGAVVVIHLFAPTSWPATLVVANLVLAAALGMGAGGRFVPR